MFWVTERKHDKHSNNNNVNNKRYRGTFRLVRNVQGLFSFPTGKSDLNSQKAINDQKPSENEDITLVKHKGALQSKDKCKNKDSM